MINLNSEIDTNTLKRLNVPLFLIICLFFFQGIPKPEPPTAEELVEVAFGQLMMDNVYAAEKLYCQAYELDKNNPEAIKGLGMVAIIRENPEEAFQYFSVLEGIKKSGFKDFLDIGLLFEKQKKFDKAEELYNYVLKNYSDCFPASYRLAKVESETGRNSQALSRLEELLKKMPEGFEKSQASAGLTFLRSQTGTK
ncbi:MAG: tetratricopeptide repeat protein [Candidatus Riflebacteria bacterium]|nr:tetratricopeptide repeat protein [Candidatus Riflebacteria bacterium]